MKMTVCAAALALALTGPAHANMTYSWREIAGDKLGDKLIVFASGAITPEDVRAFSRCLVPAFSGAG